MNDKIKALEERYDFLFDAYVQGMCDGDELEAVGAALREAKATRVQGKQP